MASRKIVSFDWAIKNILRDKANFIILEGFLLALLKEKITIVELVESESNQDSREMKFNRVDLLAVNEKGERIIIEVQYSPEQCYFKRLLYGTSKDIIDNIKTGEDYSEIKKVYSVSLIYFDVEAHEENRNPTDYVYHGKVDFTGLHNGKHININSNFLVGYDKNTEADINIFPEYFIISIDIFNNEVKDSLDEWIYSFKNHEIKEDFNAPGIKEMSEKLDFISMNSQEQRKYSRYLEDLASDRGILEYNAKKAMAEGKAEGQTEEKHNMALKLKKMDMSIKDIAGVTGLSAEELEKL